MIRSKEVELSDKRLLTCAEPRSNMFPANIPLTKFSTRFPPSSMASLRRTTSANRDIAFAFSSSFEFSAEREKEREELYK